MANLNVQTSLPASTVAASISPNNSAPDTPVDKAFGDVLKLQVDENASNNPTTMQSAPVADKKIKAEKDILASKTKDSGNPPASLAVLDLSANMIALLQPSQEIRTPRSPNASVDVRLGKTDPAKQIAVGITINTQAANIDKTTSASSPIKSDTLTLNANPVNEKQISATLVKFADSSNVPTLAEKFSLQIPQAQTAAIQNPPELLSVMPTAVTTNIEVSRNSIYTPFGDTGWADEFSQKISWMTTSQLDQVAELHLNPPDLGPLDVVLKILDNQATATFTSAHSAVRDAVENAMPKLREILADNGITLGNTTVSDQPPRDGNASSFNGQQPHAQGGRSIVRNTDDAHASTPIPAVLKTGLRHNGIVDTFA